MRRDEGSEQGHPIHTLRRWALSAALCALAACGGGGGGDAGPPPPTVAPPPTPLGAPVTQTIGSAGGSLSVDVSGVSAQLTVPAGAVAGDLAFSLTAYTSADGELARLRITPAGVAFAKPLVLRFTLPAGRTVDPAAALALVSGAAPTALPSSVEPAARSVEASISYLPASLATASAQQALRVRRLAAPPPQLPGDVALRNTTIQQRVAQAERALRALQREHKFGEAFELQTSVAMVLQSSGLDGYSASAVPWLDGAMQSACSELAAALSAGQSGTIGALGDFKRLASRLLYWHTTVQKLGRGECRGADSAAVTSTYNDLINRAVLREKELLRQNPNHGQVATETQEPADGQRLVGEALLLNDAAAAQRFKTEHVEKLLMPFREAAWAGAAQGITQAHYQQVLEGFGPGSLAMQDARYVIDNDGIKTDAQYVLTDLTASGFDRQGQRSGRTQILAAHGARPLAQTGVVRLGRGAGPGQQSSQATLPMDSDGSIELSGDIGVLRCPTPASERLVVAFEGHVVSDTAAADNRHLGSALRLQASTLLAAAGIEPRNARQHRLTVRRSGSSCNAAFGDNDRTLSTLTLDFDPKAWQPAETMATGVGRPHAVIDPTGQITLVWQTTRETWTRRWTPASASWSNPELLASAGFALTVYGLGVDDGGHVHVLWEEFDRVTYTLRTSRRDAATGLWGAAVTLRTSAPGQGRPQIAVSANGEATVTWVRGLSAGQWLDAVRYNAQTQTWGSALTLASSDGGIQPQLAADAAGNAIVAYSESVTGSQAVRSRRYSAASGSWQAEVTHAAVTGAGLLYPGLAMGPNGDAFVHWVRVTPNSPQPATSAPMAASYRAGTDTWSTAESVAPDSTGNGAYLVGMAGVDAQGQALLLLSSPAGQGTWSTHRRPAGGSWQAMDAATLVGIAVLGMPSLFIDDAGNALVEMMVSGTGWSTRSWRLDAGAAAWVAQAEASPNASTVTMGSVAGNRRGNQLLRMWGDAGPPLSLRVQRYP